MSNPNKVSQRKRVACRDCARLLLPKALVNGRCGPCHHFSVNVAGVERACLHCADELPDYRRSKGIAVCRHCEKKEAELQRWLDNTEFELEPYGTHPLAGTLSCEV